MADFVIKTPIFTGSYVNLFRPRASEEGKEPKYSICMLYKKEDFEAGKLKDLEKAIIQTAQKKFGPKAEAMLSGSGFSCVTMKILRFPFARASSFSRSGLLMHPPNREIRCE